MTTHQQRKDRGDSADFRDTYIAPRDEFIVVSAVRYARGRATYIVGMTVDWVIAHWNEFSENTKHVIARDAASALLSAARYAERQA